MNNITIAGQLGKDAETRYLQDSTAVCSFSVADSQGRDKPTIWWSCSLFGKRAEALAPYLLKGQAVTVSGVVSEREWTDQQGNKRKSMDVRVADVALQGGRREAAPAQAKQAAPAGGFDDADDDIPW